MSFLGEEFFAAKDTVYEPLPAGWYEVYITDAELKYTKNGDGKYISVMYNIVGPTHEGRVVYGNLNIKNPNPVAEEIGRQQLGSLIRAIGLSKVTDTDELIGGHIYIKLGIREASGDFDASNYVKAYKPFRDKPTSDHRAGINEDITIAAPKPADGAKKVPWAK